MNEEKNLSVTGMGMPIIEIGQEMRVKILMSELERYKRIKVPTINHSMSGEELADWLIEICSPQELDEIIFMIRLARSRGSKAKSILETIAIALLR
ncbi:hypothetical protein BGM26_19780 [Bacillus sp. FJAT-29790]|uniref:hypothetical protein n=1 Tax=Bacillus sp. FJAT-29790 TaxID=1895002 RepID=UPI001C2163B4|nr:hypothetical protein [Bacillus sp. FJAT-29790]MBU8881167.1 hypothetical protein [Bacillus sp. FJAT-29790]